MGPVALLIVAAGAAGPDTELLVVVPKDITVLNRTLFGILTNNESIQLSLAKPKINDTDLAGLHFSAIEFESESRLTHIDDACFAFCTIRSIAIPRSVTVLGRWAFFNATIDNLTFETEVPGPRDF
jgi:hypothetical protein